MMLKYLKHKSRATTPFDEFLLAASNLSIQSIVSTDSCDIIVVQQLEQLQKVICLKKYFSLRSVCNETRIERLYCRY
jgi:hypothetical protein